MNQTICSYQLLAWVIWAMAFCYVFIVEALKSYLLQFRYRELREDTLAERVKLGYLFSIVEDPNRYRQFFNTKLTVICGACVGGAWVFLVFCFQGKYGQGLSEWLQLSLLAVILFLSAVFHGLFLKWLPVALGPHLSVPVIRGATTIAVVISFLLRPVRMGVTMGIRLLNLAGIKSLPDPEPMDRDFQILATGREDVKLTDISEKIASRAIELSSITVYDILLPRNQVQIFDLSDSFTANLEKARRTGHTRFPLCVDDLDQCEGLIHIKDIFRAGAPANELDFRKLARPILRVEQGEALDNVLQLLLQKRVHMALVEDEFGGILGVLTLERILEELVGEIQDEFDKEDKMIVPLKKDFYKILGLTPLHEVEDQLGVDDLENDDVSSFGGLISNHLGRIPTKGEQVEIGPLVITIRETDETRIISAMVRVLPLPGNDQ